MRHTLHAASIVLITLFSATATAAFTQQPMFTSSITVAETDSSRDATGSYGTGLGLRFGLARSINPWLLLEVQLSALEQKDDAEQELRQISAGIDANFLLQSIDEIVPYLLVGTGLQRSTFSNRSMAQNNYLDIGLGFFHHLNHPSLSLRADLRLRRDFFDDATKGSTEYDDLIANIGVAMSFGQGRDNQHQDSSPATAAQMYPSLNDDDQDGIQDDADYCPNTEANTPIDVNGCSRKQNGVSEKPENTPAAVMDSPAAEPDMTASTAASAPIAAPVAASHAASPEDSSNDNDQDGVSNDRDLCPGTGRSDPVNLQGCADNQSSNIKPSSAQPSSSAQTKTATTEPAPTMAAKPAAPSNTVQPGSSEVFALSFATNSTALDPQGQQQQHVLARALLQRKDLMAEISVAGGSANTQNLNYRRAKIVAATLQRQGISSKRLRITSAAVGDSVEVRLHTK